MASPAPAKSQPLHNFSLPLLKWSKNHTTNHHHRARRPSDSPPPPDTLLRRSPSSDTAARRLDKTHLSKPPFRRSPMRDSASETESGHGSEKRRRLVPESGRNNHVIDPAEKLPAPEAGGSARSSKIYIKIPKTIKGHDLVPVEHKKPKSCDVPEEPNKEVEEDEIKKGQEAMDYDEFEGKTWNLRPRKPLHKKSNASANAGTSRAKAQVTSGGGYQAPAGDKKEKKPGFSIALTKQEIEDDIYSMSGSKPSRRPKKRAKNVQRQLDNIFPGLWLQNVTPEMYKVSETTPKVK